MRRQLAVLWSVSFSPSRPSLHPTTSRMAVNSDVTDQVAALLLASNEEAEYVPVELPAFATSKGDVIGKVDVPDDVSTVMKGGTAAAASDFANYFCSYAYLYHQKQMLTDHHRMSSYQAAVMENKALFEGKTVVDVGTGSGVLSVWSAQAGAAKVWAVEFTDMAKHAVKLMEHNKVADIVTVVKGAVEELDLPAQSVDVMISEWMGYFLLRESMLDSVLRARDRLLKPGGVMMPSQATMYWGAITCEADRIAKVQEMAESLSDWQQFTDETTQTYGVDMSCLTRAYKKEQNDYFAMSSAWCELRGDQVVGLPVPVKHLDLHTCTVADAMGVDQTPFVFAQPASADDEAVVSAFAGWFDADFNGSPQHPAAHPVTLSTHPQVGYTHWGQQVFYLQDPIFLSPGESLKGNLKMFRTKDNARLYHVGLNYCHVKADGTEGPTVKAVYEIP